MFALLGSKLGLFIIAAFVIGGILLYMRAQAATITKLHEQVTLLAVQADSLKAANEAMRVDMDNVQQAQVTASRALADVRATAASAALAVHNRTFSTGTPSAIQIQVNKEMSDAFSRLEAASRAK